MTARDWFAPRAPIKATALVVAAVLGLPAAALVARVPWRRAGAVLTSPEALDAVRLSLVTSTASAALCVALGLPLAWVLARTTLPGRGLVRAGVLLPLVLPPVVSGVALLAALGRRGVLGGALGALGVSLPFTTAGAVLAQTLVALPFFVIAAEQALRGVDRRYEELAATLGADGAGRARHVVLALARPGLLAGALLAWARALGEFGATITFAGNTPGRTSTLPLQIALQLERGDTEAAIVLAMVLLVASVGVLVLLRDRWLPGSLGGIR